jgi:hypothetical protein
LYICENCEYRFEEPNRIREDWGDIYVCPLCESDEISDAVECKLCGETMAFCGCNVLDKVCDGCKKDLKTRFLKLVGDEFDETEIEILNEMNYETSLFEEDDE